MAARQTLLAAFVSLAAVACNQSDFGQPDADQSDQPPGPGTEEWGDDDVACTVPEDCGAGETCEDNVCQPRRCDDGPYQSRAPLGERHLFFSDKEIVVADQALSSGSYYADLYLPGASGVTYKSGGGSYNLGSAKIVDVAAGNLTGTTVQGIAAVVSGSQSLKLVAPGAPSSLSVGFVPRAVAAGDVDADGLDEIVALGDGGSLAICHVDDEQCTRYSINTSRPAVDIATGDIDGDGVAEALILLGGNDSAQLWAWNTDSEQSGEVALFGGTFDGPMTAVAAGDFDGDRVAEVIVLQNGGWLGIAHDRLNLYDLSGGTIAGIAAATTFRSADDLAIDDIDGDEQHDVVVLGNGEVQLQRWNGSELTKVFTADLGVSGDPRRIALVDIDGDSVSAELLHGPALVAGPMRPVFALMLPPYDEEHADEPSNVWVGNVDSSSELLLDTVSLSLGLEIGVEGNFLGLFKSSLAGSVERTWSVGSGRSTALRTGGRFSVDAQPELYGHEYGAVVMSCGCFHQYTYRVDDASGRLGAQDGKFVMMVPVAGNTTMLSTHRYNALAAHRDDLPTIEIPVRIGDPRSYPQVARTLAGGPIAATDLVFPQVPNFRVSDVGSVGFYMSAGESQVETRARSTEVGVSWSGSAGITWGVSGGVGERHAYEVTVGEEAVFAGSVPSIPDDPATPEDEHAVRGFSFKPVIYREHYTDGDGNEGGYYVVSFAVGTSD